MQYSTRKTEIRDPDRDLYNSLEPVINGLGMSLIELNVFRGKGSKSGNAQIRVIVQAKAGGSTGIDDCSAVHRAIMPRLELAFSGEIYLEVSSPGIDRLIKDGMEFAHYTGRGVKCYRTDISDWTEGILLSADEKGIVLKGKDGEITLSYEIIAKARLTNAALDISGG